MFLVVTVVVPFYFLLLPPGRRVGLQIDSMRATGFGGHAGAELGGGWIPNAFTIDTRAECCNVCMYCR